jgi:hypothetical protein
MTRIERLSNFGMSVHINSDNTALKERMLYYFGSIHEIHDDREFDGISAIFVKEEMAFKSTSSNTVDLTTGFHFSRPNSIDLTPPTPATNTPSRNRTSS